VIVGAGLGGLSAACHLAGAGYDVTVLERAAQPGGRAIRREQDGFTFDLGPTVLTMIDVLAETFGAAGAEIEDHLRLRRLDPAYRAVFHDGSTIHVRAGQDAMATEIRDQCGATEAVAFHRFCEWLGDLYRVERTNFIDRNFDGVTDLLAPPSAALRLLSLGGFGRLGPRIERFFGDDRLRRLFSFQSLYAGLAPQRALALYAVITYMDTVEGVWACDGGMSAISEGLAAAAAKAGAELRYAQPVERILLANGTSGAVRGVRTASGEVLAADAVICNGDIAGTYRALLPGLTAPRVARRGHYSPSAIVWHAGVRGAPPPAAVHHNVHFGEAWDDAFDELERGELMQDPSTLVSVPSISDPGLAPPGHHVLYALEPVPNLDGDVDWPRQRDAARERLIARLSRSGYRTEAVVEHFVDPQAWAREGLERGTPFSLAHDLRQSGPFRPRNVERRAPGLFFTGAGTTPGVGVPMVLLSGKLAAARVRSGEAS
jgi:phytoene desaturase